MIGALTTGLGLALLAEQGVGGYGRFGLNIWGIVLALIGISLVASRTSASRTAAR